MRTSRRSVFLAAIALTTSCRETPAAVDLDGRALDPFDVPGARRGTVLVFVATRCPISNRYAPELHRLEETFTPRGIAFHLVYTAADDDVARIREHTRAYGLRAPALRDAARVLVDRAGASVTPEVAVFDGANELVYRGRIDDRFVAFGQMRPEPTRHDLEDALRALLEGRAPPVARTDAVGCTIAPG